MSAMLCWGLFAGFLLFVGLCLLSLVKIHNGMVATCGGDSVTVISGGCRLSKTEAPEGAAS